jgi:hypothetical protein
MFKDYLFFSNNLQDAARQILEAQEAQAKKENVEAMEPGPNEPMGQPLDEPAYDPAPPYNKVIPVNKQNGFVNKLSPKNKQVSYDKFDQDQQVKSNISSPEAISRKRQIDREEANRQGMSLEDYYREKIRERERQFDSTEQENEEKRQRQRPGTVPMDELA